MVGYYAPPVIWWSGQSGCMKTKRSPKTLTHIYNLYMLGLGARLARGLRYIYTNMQNCARHKPKNKFVPRLPRATFKNFVRFALAALLLFVALKTVLPKKKDIMPVVLLINRYPLEEEDKRFLQNVNPYGFLLSIPIHEGLEIPRLKTELEEILGRNDFLFFIDQEGGSVNRIKYFVSGFEAPAPATLGKLAQKDLGKAVRQTYEYGLSTGKALKDMAIDVVFAPLAEASAGPNTHHKSRYFSQDFHIAKELADAFASGLSDGGVIPCYKHFPGAPTTTDPHTTAQEIPATLQTLRTQNLPQFRQATRWNCLMTAHAVYPAIDKRNTSTFSPAFYRFLRKELAFDGIIFPDALNMEAADGSDVYTTGVRMNKALEAGADVVMPFFAFSADPKWMEEQIRHIQLPYIKRFQKKASLLKRRN